MHASDFQENDTAHEYHADNPDFPAKTIVATLFIGAFFGYLNDTLLNVALTPIMKDFGVDKTTVQWLTTGFLLVMGAFTPITAGVIQWFETRKMVLFTQATFFGRFDDLRVCADFRNSGGGADGAGSVCRVFRSAPV